MKKNTLFFILSALSFLSCSSNSPETTLSKKVLKNTVRIETLLPSDLKKAPEDLLSILKTTPLNLRGKDKKQLFILGLEEQQASLRILNDKGEDQFFEVTQTNATELKKFLTSQNTKINFKKATLVSKGAFSYKILSEGAIEANIPVEFKEKKQTTNLTLAFVINVESFNALNFWDGNPDNTPKDQMYIYDFLTKDFSNWYDPNIQKAKVDSTLKAIRLAGLPEVIGMQEAEYAMGNNEHFKVGSYFRTEMEKLGYKTFILGVQEEGNPVALTTAFISRYNLKDLKNIPFNTKNAFFENFSNFEKKLVNWTARDIQVAELDLNGNKVRFYNNHWRSQGCSDDESCERSEEIRKINAKVLHQELVKARKETPTIALIVLGDMNTEYYTNILKAMNNTGNERIVQDNLDDDYFYNLWYELPVEKRWDASNGGFTSTLSHILINSNLYSNN